jgi:hypothetical protein
VTLIIVQISTAKRADFSIRFVCSCFWLAGALGGGGFAQEQQPIDVIDEISHADFHCRPRDADCPHEPHRSPHF